MGYLNEAKRNFYLLSENFFTAADHFESQPILLISMLLFHVYLTCWVWGFFKSHFQWSGFFRSCGNLMEKSPLQPSPLSTALQLCIHPGPLSGRWASTYPLFCHFFLAITKKECSLCSVSLSVFAEQMSRDQEVLIQSSILLQSLVTWTCSSPSRLPW